jgi:hypothetical protein
MKKSELRQIIREEIQKLNPKDSLDSAEYYWPIPSEWFNKHYTMDFYPDGPRIFRNDNGNFIGLLDVIKHYKNETGQKLSDI